MNSEAPFQKTAGEKASKHIQNIASLSSSSAFDSSVISSNDSQLYARNKSSYGGSGLTGNQRSYESESERKAEGSISDESSDTLSNNDDDNLNFLSSKSLSSDHATRELRLVMSAPFRSPIFLSSGVYEHFQQIQTGDVQSYASREYESDLDKHISTPLPSLNSECSSFINNLSQMPNVESEETKLASSPKTSVSLDENTKIELVEDLSRNLEESFHEKRSISLKEEMDSSSINLRCVLSEHSYSSQASRNAAPEYLTPKAKGTRKCFRYLLFPIHLFKHIVRRRRICHDRSSKSGISDLHNVGGILPSSSKSGERNLHNVGGILPSSSKSGNLHNIGDILSKSEGSLSFGEKPENDTVLKEMKEGTLSIDKSQPLSASVHSSAGKSQDQRKDETSMVQGNLSSDFALLNQRRVQFKEGTSRVVDSLSLLTNHDRFVDQQDDTNTNQSLTNTIERTLPDENGHCISTQIGAPMVLYQNISENIKYNQLIWDSIKMNKLESAHSLLLVQLEHDKAKYGSCSKHVGTDLHNIAVLRIRLGQYQEAMPVALEAVRVKENVCGSSSAEVATTIIEVGVILFALEEFDRALVCFQRALGIRRQLLGDHNKNLATVLNNLACVYLELDELEKAMDAFSECLKIKSQILEENPDDKTARLSLGAVLCNVACIHTKKKHYLSAIDVYKEALYLQKSVLHEKHRSTWNVLENIAYCYLQIHAYETSLSVYERLLKMHQKYLDENDSECYRIIRCMAFIHIRNENLDEAFHTLESLVELLKADPKYWLNDSLVMKTSRLLAVVKAKQAKKNSISTFLPFLQVWPQVCVEDDDIWSTSSESTDNDIGTTLQLLTSFSTYCSTYRCGDSSLVATLDVRSQNSFLNDEASNAR